MKNKWNYQVYDKDNQLIGEGTGYSTLSSALASAMNNWKDAQDEIDPEYLVKFILSNTSE